MIGFGGPPAHITLLRQLCVQRRHWLTEEQFANGLAAANLLPGPSSTQLAIYCAWRLRGARGAIVGGLGFIVPGMIAIIALAVVFLAASPPAWLRGAGDGAGAAVPAVALQAGLAILVGLWAKTARGRRVHGVLYAIAGGVAAALAGTWLVLVLLACGAVELATSRPPRPQPADPEPAEPPDRAPASPPSRRSDGDADPRDAAAAPPDQAAGAPAPEPPRRGSDRDADPPDTAAAPPDQAAGAPASEPPPRRSQRAGMHLWPLAPLVLATAAAGGTGALVWTAFKVGALSFGGGFVIIPLMQHDAVNVYHWMTHAQFLNVVALGQVTPGPVVHTVTAVGYAQGGVPAALLAAVVAFAPSFSFILIGARNFERLLADLRVRAFLAGAAPAAAGAITGSSIPLAASLAHVWQWIVLAVAAVVILAGRRGAVPVLLFAGLVGALAGLGGLPLS